MKTDIVVNCGITRLGSEIRAIEVQLPETLGITEQCSIRQALVSNKTTLSIKDEMVKMSYGNMLFFLNPIGCNAYGLQSFFTEGSEVSITYAGSRIQISKTEIPTSEPMIEECAYAH